MTNIAKVVAIFGISIGCALSPAMAEEPTREEAISFLKTKLEGATVEYSTQKSTGGCEAAPFCYVFTGFVYQSLEVDDACQFKLKYKRVIKYPYPRPDNESTNSIVFSLREMSLDSIKVSPEQESILTIAAPKVSLDVGKQAVSIPSGSTEMGVRLSNAIKRLGVLCGAKNDPF